MKRIITTVLVFLLCMGICACGVLEKVDLPPVPTAETVTVPVETETPQVSTPVATESPAEPETLAEEVSAQVLVSVEKTEEFAYDPQFGETLILSFSYETPLVVCEENPEAAEKINEFIGLLNEAYYTGEDYGEGAGIGYNNMLTSAEDNYSMHVAMQDEEGIDAFSSARHIAIPRNDGRLLTILFNDTSYTGGAHGSYSTRGYCFDMASGERLTLADLSENEDTLCAFLTEEMLRQAREDEWIAEQIDVFVEENTLEETLTALLRNGSWYLDYDGMVIFSDLYEISSYAAGIVNFRIDNETLRGRVDERFLAGPADGEGTVRALPEEGVEDGSTEIVDMVKVFEDGTTVYLLADGSVKDLRIASVDYFDYDGSFNESAVHWSCSGLTDAAVQLVTVIPDGMPNLKISWRDTQGEQTRYLSQSGEDGSLLLVDGSIEAVG